MKEGKRVSVWEENVEIPTYEVGKPDKNPMFLEKRVYQGSSGKVYPYPVIDQIEDEKKLKSYKIIFLENEYLQIQIMPEIGGRIYRALDKTNNYDFVYYNRVIKPALVGLAGPWISGGIEFNWPQHHRPNTFGKVDHTIKHHEDGSVTVWVSEIDRMYGTKGMAGFTLYPDKAYLEINGQLYNRTTQPQTFLWWANPAVAANQYTQSVFPPDVNAVFDHGKRDVSTFPIATGTYYKMDYSAGVDISSYKNIPVPTSYMAYHSDYNFVGGYDHSKNAGILHVANHHISPGKKQWTWGNGDFGKSWDRNLTDEDGPYIELMTGVYTDNQPDFTWLHPYEEKTFSQYFMPYKDIGMVKNATIDAAVNLEIIEDKIYVSVYATSEFKKAKIELTGKSKTYLSKNVDISPSKTFSEVLDLEVADQTHALRIIIKDQENRILVQYQPASPNFKEIPEAAKAIGAPKELRNTEALFLAGQHLEQYRHATYEPDSYYLEGLNRDPDDIRINNAYGSLLLRRGEFSESEAFFRKAVETLTRHNLNPYDGEPYYNLGLSLKYQNRYEEAFNALYKATWSGTCKDKAFFTLSQIAYERGDYEEVLELVDQSLVHNARNIQARNLKAAALFKLDRISDAENMLLNTIDMDITDFFARDQLYKILSKKANKKSVERALENLNNLLRDEPHNILSLAQEYLAAGLFEDAIQLLERYIHRDNSLQTPMIYYYLGYVYGKMNDRQEALKQIQIGSSLPSDYCFPTMIWDLIVIEYAIKIYPQDAKAHYYLGNLLYDKKRHQDAIMQWERSVELNASFPTVHRNLALAYFNKRGNAKQAQAALEKAFSLNQSDARVFYELDQLYKKIGVEPKKRLKNMNDHFQLVNMRDDIYTEYVTLLNVDQQYDAALEKLSTRIFHPWEGGEGKITTQYVLSHVEVAKQHIRNELFERAIKHLEQALVFPENLGEGKLEGAQENHIHYYLGCAYTAIGQNMVGNEHFLKASEGLNEPSSAIFYNDQPPEMIFYQGLALLKLSRVEEAKKRFNKLINYGENHIFKELKIDYFAVSLPDFLVFDESLQRKNEIHCRFMMALGFIGKQLYDDAKEQLAKVMNLEPAHQGALIHLDMCED
ncbi:DUF5107 domain-containing protein [Bacillus sp. 7884-1]|uniref:DUF5107 domain-containing protein n=1 Tax=Bacillus sp. 7884-1 TaxID=2021693 RepID=UPI000BA62790|nr:DUF5107 domain-containing protein [Bacillus sp. 7884-1]PAE35431.1 DUF5107 domain-containing protein [Bacillus sp. 7884-1]